MSRGLFDDDEPEADERKPREEGHDEPGWSADEYWEEVEWLQNARAKKAGKDDRPA